MYCLGFVVQPLSVNTTEHSNVAFTVITANCSSVSLIKPYQYYPPQSDINSSYIKAVFTLTDIPLYYDSIEIQFIALEESFPAYSDKAILGVQGK